MGRIPSPTPKFGRLGSEVGRPIYLYMFMYIYMFSYKSYTGSLLQIKLKLYKKVNQHSERYSLGFSTKSRLLEINRPCLKMHLVPVPLRIKGVRPM